MPRDTRQELILFGSLNNLTEIQFKEQFKSIVTQKLIN